MKLSKARQAIVPVASSVLRRAILRSPDHAQEIGAYARAVGGVFCRMAATKQFDPAFLMMEADKATAGLQVGVDPTVIDAKNGAIALYQIFLSDQTMLPVQNDWALAICQLFCEAISQGLKDAGQPGVTL